MINVQSKTINPDIAMQLIMTNELNRVVNRVRVSKYAEEMKSGLWKSNGDTIKIDRNGVLIDGQHRLHAIIESMSTIDFLVVSDLSEDAMPTIDTGMPRKSNQVLQIRGEKHSTLLNSMIRCVYRIRSAHQMTTPYLSTQEIIKMADSLPNIRTAVAEVVKFKKQHLCPPSLLGGVYYEGSLKDKSLAIYFLQQIATGLEIEKTSPIYILRDRLIKNCKAKLKMTFNEVLALHIKTWNALRNNEEPQMLYWSPKHHRFPEME